MVRLIKIDGVNSFFVDTKLNDVVYHFDPRLKDRLKLIAKLEDDSVLTVYPDKLNYENGRISFDCGPDRFIVDDGYQNILIRAGYLILNEYDKERIEDRDEGIKIRSKLLENVDKAIGEIDLEIPDIITLDKSPRYLDYFFDTYGYSYTIFIDTNNNIVDKNIQRKADSLPFYPFLKNMDKYGTLYISIFCQKHLDNTSADDKSKYPVGDIFIRSLIKELNKISEKEDSDDYYHFSRVIVKKKIIID